MKTKEQIAEMAEREYPIGTKKTMELLKEGFINGYQTAQKDMKQCPTCKALTDTWDNDKDEQFNNI
jgi:hypothetical protein